jgi:hypothetical protein
MSAPIEPIEANLGQIILKWLINVKYCVNAGKEQKKVVNFWDLNTLETRNCKPDALFARLGLAPRDIEDCTCFYARIL